MLDEKTQEKIKNKQNQINSNEDLSSYGYIRKGKSSNGTTRWIFEEFKRNYDKQYHLNHKLKSNIRSNLYHKNHREEILKWNKINYLNHKDEYLQRNKTYYYNHRNRIIKQVMQYRHTEKGRLKHKQQSYERRGLRFNRINEPIIGIECIAHHVNKNDVIFIPEVIHQKIPHNLKTGKNMKLINSIAEGFK